MTTKRPKKKTIKKVKDTTEVGVLEGEIVESKEAEDAGKRAPVEDTDIRQAVYTDVQINGTKALAFMPTKKMMQWLNYQLENPNAQTGEVARATNISTNSYYAWRTNLDFLRWFKAEWDKRLVMHAPKLDQIGLKNSDGNYKYWLSMQQRVGNLEQQQVKLQNNIQMNVNFIEEDTQPSE